MARKRRLLIAATTLGYARIRPALIDNFDLVAAFDLMEATAALKQDGIDAILASIHFNESRMFDLLREAKHLAPGTPFVCCVIQATSLSSDGLQSTMHAAKEQGALGCIDYNGMQRSLGFDAANRAFCERLLQLLGPPRRSAAAL